DPALIEAIGAPAQLLERGARRRPGRAHLLLQHHEREVVRPSGASGIAPDRVGDEVADLTIEGALAGGLADPQRLDLAGREGEVGVGPPCAHHHRLEQGAQARGVARRALVVAAQEVAPELRERPHRARPHQGGAPPAPPARATPRSRARTSPTARHATARTATPAPAPARCAPPRAAGTP